MSGNQMLAHRYREVAVNTANPLQLVVMLYDAAICSLNEAREHIKQRNVEGRSRSLNKCISIISELQSSLNLKAGGEIASSLDRLYDYMKRRIFSANVEQSARPLNEIAGLLENLRSAWHELSAQNAGLLNQVAGSKLQNLGILEAAPSEAIQLKTLNISI